jgi:predicted Fe-S protein YdhL (DUF1289 family)
MKRPRQAHRWLAIFAAAVLPACPLFAQDSANFSAPQKSFFARTNGLPAAGRGKSPVDFFRQLLAMTPDDRDNFLTNRPPQIRVRILAKVAEYEALDPNERELRLRATELRWYLMPLLREPATNQAAMLTLVPPDVRELIQARLEEWTILPPTLRDEFLANEHILYYFAHVDTRSVPAENSPRAPDESERAHWNGLSEAERRQITDGFNQFFELTPDEKQKAMNTLSETERQQMEKTLQSFDKMPASQRSECVNAFAKFASMNPIEKTEFLKNAERWSAMSPAERQAWRDLVVNVPQWPPLPLGALPAPPTDVQRAMVTNKN